MANEKLNGSVSSSVELQFSNGWNSATGRNPSATNMLIGRWLLLYSHWRIIAISVLGSVILAVIYAKLLATPQWQANATLIPVGEQKRQSELLGFSEILVGGGDLSSLLGGSEVGDLAQEYMATMKSYEFTMALVDRYHFAELIDPTGEIRGTSGPQRDPRWQFYRFVSQALFSCDFDQMTNEVKLHFLAPSRALATRALQLYLKHLNDVEATREEAEAKAAVAWIEAEIRTTSDPQLQPKLAELQQRQFEREKLAHVEADLSFKVIEHPISADRHYSPSLVLDSALAVILALFVSVVAILGRETVSNLYREYERDYVYPMSSGSAGQRLPKLNGPDTLLRPPPD
jgi:Chain length determinant protein